MKYGKEMLTIAETAKLLSISKPTVYRMVASKEICATKVRGQWRIPQEVLRKQFIF